MELMIYDILAQWCTVLLIQLKSLAWKALPTHLFQPELQLTSAYLQPSPTNTWFGLVLCWSNKLLPHYTSLFPLGKIQHYHVSSPTYRISAYLHPFGYPQKWYPHLAHLHNPAISPGNFDRTAPLHQTVPLRAMAPALDSSCRCPQRASGALEKIYWKLLCMVFIYV